MVQYGAFECVWWLNTFAPKRGVSTQYSPRVIMAGKALDYDKHCTTGFGSYVQAFQENTPTNTTAQPTIGCIYLRLIESGGYELLNLMTGKVITRRKITEVSITQEVINVVEQMPKDDGMKPDLVFKNQKGEILLDDDFIAGVDIDQIKNQNPENEDHQSDDNREDLDDSSMTKVMTMKMKQKKKK